jgi:hypothetical protein
MITTIRLSAKYAPTKVTAIPDGLLKPLQEYRSEQRHKEQRDWHRLAVKKMGR